MQSSTPLTLPARSAIVLLALLQGLMLYAAQELSDAWPFRDIGWRYCWYAWVLAIPSAVALSLVELGQRRLWLQAVLGSTVVLALAAWIGWNLNGETALESGALQLPLTLGMAVAVFVVLPWWQFQLQHGHWRASYPELFERAWQNGLTLALAALFTGLTWLLLWLWSALFQLLDVTVFRDLFRQDAFIALATGSLAGFGVLIGRTQHRAIQITRQVLFAICRGLLPLLSFIAVLFVLSLPLTGLEPLWKTRSAAGLLLVLSLLLVTFTNAVYQQGKTAPPTRCCCAGWLKPACWRCRSTPHWRCTHWGCAWCSTAGPWTGSGRYLSQWPWPAMPWATRWRCCAGSAAGCRCWSRSTAGCAGRCWHWHCWATRRCWTRCG